MPKNIASKQDWLNLGLQLLNEKGRAALVVEKMSKHLCVSKTSFYWHFKTRKEFLIDLARYWVEQGTQHYIDSAAKYETDRERLFHLTQEVFTKGHSRNSIRYWREIAQENEIISEIVTNVELQRITYIQSLLSSEFDSEKAYYRADMLYHYFLGWSERHQGVEIDKGKFQELWVNVIEPVINNPETK
jgi:AcrR family transcriptional regulator